MSVRRHHSPDNKQFVNIILTQRTSLLIRRCTGCEARHYLFFLFDENEETADQPLFLFAYNSYKIIQLRRF